MPLSIPIVVLGAPLLMMVADRPPNFDISRTCILDLSATYGESDRQRNEQCTSDEQNARKQLETQWLEFPATARATCASMEGVGGTPSYVSLLTCVQMYAGK
jgi:hypothetical protein